MPTVSVVYLNSQGLEVEDSEKIFIIESGSVIFDALEAQGFIIPNGCLAGSCGVCRCFVINGYDNLSMPNAVEKDTLESVKLEYKEIKSLSDHRLRLSCRAKCLGDIKIGIVK